MKKPIIGIVVKPLLAKQLTRTLWNRLVINDEFRQLIVMNGGIPLGIMPNKYCGNSDTSDIVENMNDSDREDLFKELDLVDGIILQGGLTSDSYEVEIVKYAIENDIPIIGICAGFNNIARAAGASLLKTQLTEIHDVYDKEYRHPVIINTKHHLSQLFINECLGVNSLHQLVLVNECLPETIEVLATSDNNKFVEAFTVQGAKFCFAVKWHPEIMLEDISTQNIFAHFMNACKNDT